MLDKKNTGNGEAQGKADEENQLTGSNITIPFFKRRKSSGFHSSVRGSHEAEVQGEGENKTSTGETHSEPTPFYSPKAGFNRAQYESTDTGRPAITPLVTSYKSFLMTSIANRGREDALAEQKQDSALEECASPNCSN